MTTTGWHRWVRLMVAALLMLPIAASAADSKAPARVWVMDLQGAIGPATSRWFTDALDDANRADASLFVLRLDTPGGLDSSMRAMIQAILASKVPVATYVAPSGSRAASAGTYILYASPIAAMAPATNLGAATPVSLQGSKPGATEHRKIVNDAVAYIRGLAQLNGRNADWAEQAVRGAVSLSADEALKKHVVDLLAPDLPALLSRLNGQKVTAGGETRILDLHPYQLHTVKRDWRTDFLAVITDPNIAYLLLLAGIFGLIVEFAHPGTGVPGVLGGVSLLLGLYALQMLPVSYAGLGLIALGVGLIVAEALSPSFGILGIGGGASFLIGSLMLMDTHLAAFRIALPMIAAVGVAILLMIGMMVRMAVKAQHERQVTGDAQLIGETAVALEDFDGLGQARLHGEVWRVRAPGPVRRGDRLRVRGRDGLTLDVEVEA